MNPTELGRGDNRAYYVTFIPKEGTLRAHLKFGRLGAEKVSQMKPNE